MRTFLFLAAQKEEEKKNNFSNQNGIVVVTIHTRSNCMTIHTNWLAHSVDMYSLDEHTVYAPFIKTRNVCVGI